MSAKVLAENLPAGSKSDQARLKVATCGAPVYEVTQGGGDGPDLVSFVAKLNVNPSTARLMVGPSDNRMFKGRKVSCHVSRLMD